MKRPEELRPEEFIDLTAELYGEISTPRRTPYTPPILTREELTTRRVWRHPSKNVDPDEKPKPKKVAIKKKQVKKVEVDSDSDSDTDSDNDTEEEEDSDDGDSGSDMDEEEILRSLTGKNRGDVIDLFENVENKQKMKVIDSVELKRDQNRKY